MGVDELRADRMAGRTAGRRAGRVTLLVLAGTAVIYLAWLPPTSYSVDGASMFATATALASGDGFVIGCDQPGAVPGRDGSCFSIWYPLLSVVAAPVVALVEVAAAGTGMPAGLLARGLVVAIPSLGAAVAAACTYRIARVLGAGNAAAVGAAAVLALATEVATYARTFFAETLAAALVSIAVLSLFERGWAWRWGGAVCLFLLPLAKPPLAVAGLVVVGVAAVDRRFDDRRWVWCAGAGLVLGVAATLGLNWWRFGSVTDFGTARDLVLGHLPGKATTLLVSPGRGLLVYSPVVAVGVAMLARRRDHPLSRLALGVTLTILGVVSLHPVYGWDWASRHLVPALPLLVAPVALALRRPGRLRVLALGAAVAGFVANLPNHVSFFELHFERMRAAGVTAADLAWSLPHAPLVGVWSTATRAVGAALDEPVSGHLAASGAELGADHVVGVWWWMLPAVGVPWVVGLALGVALTVLGAALLVTAARRAGDVAGGGAPPDAARPR